MFEQTYRTQSTVFKILQYTITINMLFNFNRYTQISILNKCVYRKKHHPVKIITSVFFRKHYFRSLLIYTSILYTSIIDCSENNIYTPWAFFISTVEINSNSFYFKKLLLK